MQSYTVTGMSCAHCVAAVTAAVAAIDGVRDVVVDLDSDSLTFNSDRWVSSEAVGEAVQRAGYALE